MIDPVADNRADAMARAGTAARDSYGRLLAILASATSDVAGAEDALADAFERALRTWPTRGVPDNPDGWLLTVARNRLRDRWRSADHTRSVGAGEAGDVAVHLDDVDPDAVPDKRLELLLVCAHPEIEPAARTPLMLDTVLGFTAAQIGRCFAVPTTTMATRLTRAKKRIKQRRIPFELPDRAALPSRMDAVLEAVYGAYVIDWATTGAEARPVPPETLELAEILAHLVPTDPEVRGLAALVALSAARRPAARGPAGEFVALADQDPARWDAALIDRAHGHLRAAHTLGAPGRFQIEAAIGAAHCARRDGRPTNWATICDLHRLLYRLAPGLGTATALAAAVGETDGPAAGLDVLDELVGEPTRFQPAWATRAHLLAGLGRTGVAADAYEKAISLTHDPAERRALADRRKRLRSPGGADQA